MIPPNTENHSSTWTAKQNLHKSVQPNTSTQKITSITVPGRQEELKIVSSLSYNSLKNLMLDLLNAGLNVPKINLF